MSMDVFRHCETPLQIDMDPYGEYVYYLWALSGIVWRPLLYSPLGQSYLVGTYVHFLWPFFGSVPSPFINIQRYATPLLIFIQNPDENIKYWPRPTNKILSAGPWIVYGRFPALFITLRSCIARRHRSFPNLSAPTCISYGRCPALFSRFFCSIEMSREPGRSTIVPSFEIVLTSQTIISKRAT